MIQITRKEDCCGCNACAQKCPNHCISMVEDKEGFLYPMVDESQCVECGLCERICPIKNHEHSVFPIKVLAAYNKDTGIRESSSSGGIFTLLAEKVIAENGVVFGVAFNERWEAVLDYTETKEGVAAFRGCKYVQAEVGNAFIQCEHFLKAGRKVLFSGTPCQITALKRFLVHEYENLLTVDVVCHGVPSPMIWHKYLQAMVQSQAREIVRGKYHKSPPPVIKSIKFRDKSEGWKKYHFVLELVAPPSANQSSVSSCGRISEEHGKNLFMRAFISDLILRPSCYSCPFRGKPHPAADISIGDFWGVQDIRPDLDDDKGVSIIILNTQKGESYLPMDNIVTAEVCLAEASKYNAGLQDCVYSNQRRELFFERVKNSNDVLQLMALFTAGRKLPMWKRFLRKVKHKVASKLY